MVSFIQLVLALCMLRAGPQDMPLGRVFLAGSAAAYCLVMVAVFSLTQWTVTPAALALQSTVFLALVVRLILSLAGHSQRTPQSLTALYASSAVMNLLPLLLQGLAVLGGALVWFLNVMFITLFFWSFAVDAHIFSRALNTSLWLGLFVAVMIFIVGQIILSPWQAMV